MDPGAPPPALSQSIAWTLLSRSPFHAWHEHRDLGGLERPPTKAMDTGTLVHDLVLGGERKVVVCDFRDWRTKEAIGARAAIRDDGCVPILRKEVEAVGPVVDAIHDALNSNGLTTSQFVLEQRLKWKHGDVPCEGTPDAYLVEADGACVWDLKTTKRLGNRLTTGRNAAQSGWAIQREAYVSALESLYPGVAGRVQWYWVIVDLEGAHQVRVVRASPSMVELGRLQWERAVITWGELLARGWETPWSDDWPLGLEAPEYELARETAALDELIGASDAR